MRIGIDARFVGPQGTGLGKYTQKLIQNLAVIDGKNKYFIFLKQENWSFLKLPKNFTKVLADVSWYSLDEQIKMPRIFNSQNLDLVHIPHFNAPIFYKGIFVVTIHDLIHHHFAEQSATTKNNLIFKFKRMAYRLIIYAAIKNSRKIITPSNAVRDEILKTFRIPEGKVKVTYEAAEEEYFSNRQPSTVNRQPSTILYVGNVYPHKNISNLLEALKNLPQVKLKIVCARDVFWERLDKEIRDKKLEKRVETVAYQQSKDLVKIFARSQAYVFPSLAEGFGIPGLNAMAASLPVVCANIPVLKEVYADAAIYFNPKDPADIAAKIEKVLKNKKTQADLIKKGSIQVKKYSWKKMARQTLKIYEETLIN